MTLLFRCIIIAKHMYSGTACFVVLFLSLIRVLFYATGIQHISHPSLSTFGQMNYNSNEKKGLKVVTKNKSASAGEPPCVDFD